MNTSRELRQHYREVLSQAHSKDAGDKDDAVVTFDFACARQLMDIIQDADNAELLEEAHEALARGYMRQRDTIHELESKWYARLAHWLCFYRWRLRELFASDVERST